MSQVVLVDDDQWHELATRSGREQVRRILLVCGDASFARTGIAPILARHFGGCLVRRFGDFDPNPTLAAVKRALTRFESLRPDWLLAVGGGSAIDLAKCVKGLAGVSRQALTRWERELVAPAPRLAAQPLVAVPTTAGSGSEATHFAAVYVGNRKFSLAHAGLLPRVALLDASLTASLSPRQAACSGLDALAQAVEALWSVNASPASDCRAFEALERIVPALPPACAGDAPARKALLLGAHAAGQAIDSARTTAAHAFSYALTQTCGLPHGQAVWLTFPHLVLYNYAVDETDCRHPQGAAFVRRRIEEIARRCGQPSVAALAAFLLRLARQLGIDLSWPRAGVGERDAALRILAQGDEDRLAGNPRAVHVPTLLDRYIWPRQEAPTA